ncbi:hypothetical protein OG884_07075 [Streptosporangium sp. NBC_01755]|uniref:hypothetical protein n=1 Tax=unclassified Streptosporangium TaxID=2632669 RepID=UPI002DD82D37|nr:MULTISPECIES: hypothetical protein [unclassified Streptosporangium]WSA26896.1 hypothetical protein OIE13_03075 [Streptosporangium sp. NBC_01810]WSD01679.1 hypothetical protein OG884_07075 [Streptosporangium sp. NBC_01755]
MIREEGGAWGALPAVGSRTFITTAIDRERLFDAFVGESTGPQACRTAAGSR